MSLATQRPAYIVNKKQKQIKAADSYLQWKRNNCDETWFDYVVGLAEESGNKLRLNKPLKHPTNLTGFEQKLYFEVFNNVKKQIEHNKAIDKAIDETDDYNEKMELSDYYNCAVILYET